MVSPDTHRHTFFIPDTADLNPVVMPNGTKVTRVFSKDSFYGNLKVVDYSYGIAHTRELIIDGLIQGGIDMNNSLPVYEYMYFMEFLPYSLNPARQELPGHRFGSRDNSYVV